MLLTAHEYNTILGKLDDLTPEEIEAAYELVAEYESYTLGIELLPKQKEFCDSRQEEVLYGGACAGGKTFVQIYDSWLKAIEYPGIRQIFFRQELTMLDLEVIPLTLALYDTSLATYNNQKNKWIFNNGSVIQFAYLSTDKDLNRYQGASFHIIRYDEATHFTQKQLTFLKSWMRSTDAYPKQIKYSTNPGGAGHLYLKERFVDDYTTRDGKNSLLLFIPAFLSDNPHITKNDPGYAARIGGGDAELRRKLLEGDWDVCEGQFFQEFKRDIHIVQPFELNKNWKRFLSMDYGLDMLSVYWYALSPHNDVIVYRELYQPNLNLSQAAKAVSELITENYMYISASPDLWNRRQETGQSGKDIMQKAGLKKLLKANDSRVIGWRTLREFLTPYEDGQGIKTAKLRIFSTCYNLIRCLPALQHDKHNPEDAAGQPHEITHAPESLRYGIMSINKSRWNFIKKGDV